MEISLWRADTLTVSIAQVEVGGTFLIEMRGDDGENHVTRGVYRDVVPNRRLVHTWRWEGSDVESLVTVELEPESAGRTRLTLTHSRFASVEARDQHERGWRVASPSSRHSTPAEASVAATAHYQATKETSP